MSVSEYDRCDVDRIRRNFRYARTLMSSPRSVLGEDLDRQTMVSLRAIESHEKCPT